MPWKKISSSNSVQPPTYLCCAYSCYLAAAAPVFSCWASHWWENTSHQLPPWEPQALPWLFWEDLYSSCSVYVFVRNEEGLGHSSKIKLQRGVRQGISSQGRRQVEGRLQVGKEKHTKETGEFTPGYQCSFEICYKIFQVTDSVLSFFTLACCNQKVQKAFSGASAFVLNSVEPEELTCITAENLHHRLAVGEERIWCCKAMWRVGRRMFSTNNCEERITQNKQT